VVDINKQIRMAVKTGKVGFGSKDAIVSTASARVKMIILAKNIREAERDEIRHNAEQSEIPIYVFPGSSLDLGAVCEKPFPVSAIVVREAGDSDVLKLVAEKK
jgi:large subunit ribosomal protein L30e